MSLCFQCTFGVYVFKSSAKKNLKRHLLSPKIAMLLILVETFYAVLLTYLNFNLGRLAFEGRKSRSAVTGDFSSACLS